MALLTAFGFLPSYAEGVVKVKSGAASAKSATAKSAGKPGAGAATAANQATTNPATTNQATANQATTKSATTTTGGNKLFGQVSVFGSACLSSGFRPESTQLPTTVEQVKMGTPAFNAGLAVGDRILSAKIGDNLLHLRIERSGKQYELSLRARTDIRLDGAAVNLKSDLYAQLRNYRISFIVDRSGSMSRPLGETGKTVWYWVKERFSAFAEQVEGVNHQPFDLVLFADNYDVMLAQTAAQVRSALSEAVTTGDTNLRLPLAAYLKQVGVSSARPLLLIIVTDGKSVSASNDELTAILTTACREGKPGMKVLFLQTGYSEEGQRFALGLSSALKAGGLQGFAGAADFGQVQNGGLAGLLKPLF
ncbi:MAG: VWA domain-containing protein [Candidatus Melainabacteria bacterium]|nr:VWA domain-containing protein [Candidatus Melainabacteria bacterium]